LNKPDIEVTKIIRNNSSDYYNEEVPIPSGWEAEITIKLTYIENQKTKQDGSI